MKMQIGQLIYAIAFQHENSWYNYPYYFATPERPAKHHLLALTVLEERPSKCEHTGNPVEEPGYILVDQQGRQWAHNYPTQDSSGQGVLFMRAIPENLPEEELKRIMETEICAARTLEGFLQSIHMELANLKNPREHHHFKDQDNTKLIEWMEKHKAEVTKDAEEKLYVRISSTPHVTEDGKALDGSRFVRYTVEGYDFTDAGVKTLTFLAMFGDMKHWPQILMRNMDFEFACFAYREVFGQSPTNTAQLFNPKVCEHMQLMLKNMRAHLQGLFDTLSEKPELAPRPVREHKPYVPPMHHSDEAHAFRDMSKPSEFGTIAEICAKYGISKSEARRRKAEGTLHELE